MVPVTCNICKRRVIMWDTRPVFAYEYDEEIKGHKVLSATVCNICIPDDQYRVEPITKPHHKLAKAVEPEPFSEPEDGSEMRYNKRKSEHPWWKHTGWWVVHNCVAHVLIGVLPLKPFFQFHDWTSRKMHGK